MRQHTPAAYKETAYTDPILPLTAADVEYFFSRFGVLCVYAKDIRRTEDYFYLLPVYRSDGSIRGYVKRLPTWSGPMTAPIVQAHAAWGGPKAINYLESAKEVPMSWHIPSDRRMIEHTHVVLVEDIISAMRIQSLGVTAVALMGCSLSDARVRELQQNYRLKCTWAPDPDAIGTALKHTQKYGPAFQDLRVVFLDCDAKDYYDSDKLLHDLKVYQ
jgi:hypothetical protein